MQKEPTLPSAPELPPDDPRLEVDGDGIGWITFDDRERRHNVLTEATMRRLGEVVEKVARLARAKQVRVVVFRSGKEDSFIAGADVEAIAAIEDPAQARAAVREGQEIYLTIEQLPLPTVAAIDGLCLGGGTELALACRFRVASDAEATRIGLPEVQLGILPAWGGTTRLPRLVGLQAALDMLLTGKNISPSKAERIGLVSEVLPHQGFRDEVGDFALRAVEMPRGASRPRRSFFKRLAEDTSPGRMAILAAARRKVMDRTGGQYPAPLRILDLLGEHLGGRVSRSLEAEVTAAGDLITHPITKNLIHIFHLREAARKDARMAPGTEPREVTEMGVLGAGVMGGGIAQLAAYHDLRVRMKDIDRDAVGDGLRHARKMFDKAVERRKLDRREADQRMERIAGGTDYHGFATLDLVVEAVVERMDVKRTVLQETEDQVPETCVIATNTSSLSVDAMAEGMDRPERFAGMHFFNPVHRMPLVEVVRGERTDDVTVATVHALAVRLGKVPVICRDGPGFVVNRILGPYLNEAGWLLADGASIEAVDRAAEAFGMPMGPLRLVDEVGIDIARHAGDTLHRAFGERMEPAPPLVRLGETERLGRKNERGLYRYRDGEEEGVDQDVYRDLAESVPPKNREMDEGEVRDRLFLAMANEAVRVLEDRIVERAGDVDLAIVMGTGFPPFRGGILRWADSLGPAEVLDRLESLRERFGARFEPADLIHELAERNGRFYGVRHG